MPMKAPPHPGHSIKDVCLEALELNVTDAPKVLGVARHTLSRVINGKAAYDLAQARKHQDRINVQRYESALPS